MHCILTTALIQALRREILLMKVFLLCCKTALKKKLLLKVSILCTSCC